jgi:type II secretory pathway predicted ATPase ExeA
MFLDFYNLKEQPFGVTPDHRFLYLGKSHREALASLYYGIESDRGFVALIAQPGLGKTTLTFQLLEKLQQSARTVFLFQTQCNARELFHYLLNGLGVEAAGMELVSMHNKLNEILAREMLAGRRFVLAIDEAQNLDPQVLEAIRLLSNFETPGAKLLQILLIGQPQLARKLASTELEQLQQRISVFARLEPFGAEDTARYIAHRLQVAGYEGEPLFSPGALRFIAEHSQGIPRKINALCFSALSLGCAMGRKQVDLAIMEEVLADRDVESMHQPKAPLRAASASVAPRLASASPIAPRPSQPSPPAARQTLSYHAPAKPGRSLARWALFTTSVAAAVAIAIGLFLFSPSRSDKTFQVSSDAWATLRSFVMGRSGSAPHSSSMDVQAAELPTATAGPSSVSNDEIKIDTAIVQPGETLRRIVLRTLGEYDVSTIEQIWKLNPDVSDFDHIQAGRMIRLPRPSSPADSAAAVAAPVTDGKN